MSTDTRPEYKAFTGNCTFPLSVRALDRTGCFTNFDTAILHQLERSSSKAEGVRLVQLSAANPSAAFMAIASAVDPNTPATGVSDEGETITRYDGWAETCVVPVHVQDRSGQNGIAGLVIGCGLSSDSISCPSSTPPHQLRVDKISRHSTLKDFMKLVTSSVGVLEVTSARRLQIMKNDLEARCATVSHSLPDGSWCTHRGSLSFEPCEECHEAHTYCGEGIEHNGLVLGVIKGRCAR